MEYEHLCKNCNKEFELEYSMKEDPPTKCILCGFDGKVERLISGATPGRVELTGRDLKNHLKAEGQKIARESLTNESLKANLIGPDVYQKQVVQHERLLSNLGRPKIRSKKS